MTDYDLGMAVEFLFCARVQQERITVKCNGEQPCALSHTESEPEFKTRCTDYTIQKNPEDPLNVGNGCHLIKLHHKDPALDFLKLDNPAGVVSCRLFSVQVSSQKYQGYI